MKETVSVNGIVNDRSDPLSKKSPKLGMLIIRVIKPKRRKKWGSQAAGSGIPRMCWGHPGA